MVTAILAGTKTQTRRVEPFAPVLHAGLELGSCVEGRASYRNAAHSPAFTIGPRYGVPGDSLWMRERWGRTDAGQVLYAADQRDDAAHYGALAQIDCWRPSIHLRKEDARPTRLPIAAHERVERLQDISEEDAQAEGVSTGQIPPDDYGPARIGYVLGPDDGKCTLYPTPQEAYLRGWDKINGARGFPSSLNPWVRVVTWSPKIDLAKC